MLPHRRLRLVRCLIVFLSGAAFALASAVPAADPPSVLSSELPFANRLSAPKKKDASDARPPEAAGGKKEADEPKKEDAKQEEAPKPFWETVPPVSPIPRLGLYFLPPEGPGYWSLCDLIEGNLLEKPPAYPYPRFGLIPWPFFDYSFAYLEKPDNREFDYWDCVKRIHCGDDFLLSLGGDLRYRYVNEVHSRVGGGDNNYSLSRVRLFSDLWYLDNARLYVEYIDAQSYWEDLVPAPIDRNHSDLLNCFVDLKLCETDCGRVYLRGGRQELGYGSQRLISPLDWANTRRTFQGAKMFLRGEKFDADLFCVQPVVPNVGRFDSVDNDVVFSGLWTTYRPKAGQFFDLYYLNLDQARHVAKGRDGVLGATNVSTVGARYIGDSCNWLYDVEGMLQFGTFSNQTKLAKAFTIGGGYDFKQCCSWSPQFWVYCDYASGDPDPGVGDLDQTFNQLFPFGHYYLGYIDVVARQNIVDINGQFVFYPARWLTSIVQYHIFYLDSPKDALYNAAGVPVRRDPTGKAGSQVGDELDLLLNIHVDKHQDVLVGYSHLFPGEFLQKTGSGRSVDYFYLQYSYRW